VTDPTLFQGSTEPLAARMRPKTLDQFLGQEHLLGPGKALGELIRRGEIGSCIFWGPPGSGKTTLARIIANYTDRHFEPFSAVTEGVPRVREIIKEAEERLKYQGQGTILFCDEIHRFNRAQQDAFLPWVENGIITLIGATTENPSFELTGALLSRCRVFVLEPLSDEHVRTVLNRALEQGAGSREQGAALTDEAVEGIVRHAQGDARRALNTLEAVLKHIATAPGSQLPAPIGTVLQVLEKPLPIYDKSGEQHYNLISALHKAVRGSDPQGALYWLARMLAGGEDPLYLARRLVRIASEDVGLADPRALSVALAAKDAYHFLGSPEGTGAGRGDDLPRDGAQVESGLRRVRGSAGGGQDAPCRAGAAPHSQRAHRSNEGLGLWRGVQVRVRFGPGVPPAGIPARSAARRELVYADRLRVRKDHQGAHGMVAKTQGIVVALLALTGCATLRNALNFQEPQVELQEINITGMGLTGGTMDLVFDVYNPNDYRLRSTRLEVGLDLEGTHFGDALIDRPLDLSPTNHSRVVMPVRFEWAGVGAAARGLLTRQELKYGVTGAVLLETPLGGKRVQLRAAGNVPLKKLF